MADVGADAREVLARHGYSEDDIMALVESKLIPAPDQDAPRQLCGLQFWYWRFA